MSCESRKTSLERRLKVLREENKRLRARITDLLAQVHAVHDAKGEPMPQWAVELAGDDVQMPAH